MTAEQTREEFDAAIERDFPPRPILDQHAYPYELPKTDTTKNPFTQPQIIERGFDFGKAALFVFALFLIAGILYAVWGNV